MMIDDFLLLGRQVRQSLDGKYERNRFSRAQSQTEHSGLE